MELGQGGHLAAGLASGAAHASISVMSASTKAPSVEVRTARPDDLPAITGIYNHYIEAGPITFDVRPCSPEERRPWFEHFAERGRYRLLVAEREGHVIGYAGTLPFREKPAYETSVETTIYLAPDETGHGTGALLYTRLFDAIAGEDLHRAYAGITLPNEPSVRLHERFGFERVARYREVGRKHGRYWDVGWYEKALPHAAGSGERG